MTLYQVPQGRTLSCKQLRNPKRHGALKNRNGQTLMHMTVGVNEEHLLASLVDAGVSVTAVNARGETGWQAFVRAWVVRYHGTPLFYLALKSFIARLGASVDVTCLFADEADMDNVLKFRIGLKFGYVRNTFTNYCQRDILACGCLEYSRYFFRIMQHETIRYRQKSTFQIHS